MNYKVLKKIAIALLILLFFTPVIAEQISVAGADAETAQYGSLLFLGMGAFNIPIVLASLAGIIAGVVLQKRLKTKAANISLIISILISVVGIITLLSWGFAKFD